MRFIIEKNIFKEYKNRIFKLIQQYGFEEMTCDDDVIIYTNDNEMSGMIEHLLQNINRTKLIDDILKIK